MSERKFIRFKPDDAAVAMIDLKNSLKEFKPTLAGLILNESFSGCALIITYNEPIKTKLKIKIKIGNLHPMKAEVVWSKNLEENIQKIGVRLLE